MPHARLLILTTLAAVCLCIFADGCRRKVLVVKENADGFIPWSEAVAVIHQADVQSVGQTHGLHVGITLKDGTRIRTIEPEIDAVFKEVEAAGLSGKISEMTE